jgi:hypothetical protein
MPHLHFLRAGGQDWPLMDDCLVARRSTLAVMMVKNKQ